MLSGKDKLPKEKKGFVVSKYVSRPHLINGFKYDLRLYVLVTSYDPLVIYKFQDGLVRFATVKYNLKGKDLKNRFIHLTNYSINKKAENYVQNSNGDENQDDGEGGGASKWSYKQLKDHIIESGQDWEAVDSEINDVIIKTVISIEPAVVSALRSSSKNRSPCFELYGFDVILD